MNERLKEVLDFYKQFHKENKCHPTVTMVANHFGVKRQTIQARLKTLVNNGYLTKVYDGAFIHTSKK